uniref:Chorismate lyase n=1 Tax=Antithamnion hubbsii TaxID=1005974 RepID=A0A4D6WLI6_9FLOR|nr:hypothetical protein [Antithamnion hubbsii]
MNIYPIQNFHPILKITKNTYANWEQQISNFIPLEWQFILMNDGSFTQNLNALLIQTPAILGCQKFNPISKSDIKSIRIVWLENDKKNKFTFARSIWLFNHNICTNIDILSEKPLGYSLIQNETDINKDIKEIYYGYNTYLESKFNSKEPIWGRKYNIYYKKRSYITIEEFFSPKLINLFQIDNYKLIN